MELRFNEPVLVVPNGIVLRSADSEVPGTVSADGVVVTFVPQGVIPDGTAVLDWRVASDDGHLIGGRLVFHVREATEALPPDTGEPTGSATVAIANVLTYMGLLLGGGVAIFTAYVHDGGPEARDLNRLSRALLGVGVLGAVASVTLKSVEISGGLDFDTFPSGTVPMMAMLVPGVLTVMYSKRRLPFTLGVLAALVSLAFVGHTRTFGPTWLVASADVVHLAAGSAWVGGLTGLAVVARRRAEGRSHMASMVRHFSIIAAWTLVAVVVSGIALTWRTHGSWANLVGTTHGRLVLAKVAIVFGVGTVAAFNRYRVLPSMASARAAGRLATATAVEAGGLALLLVITGFLVEQDPMARSASTVEVASGPVQTRIGDHALSLDLEPGRVGVNSAVVVVRTPEGDEVDLASPPRIAVVDDSGERITYETERAGNGYVATIEIRGSGAMEVRARVDTFTEATQTIRFDGAGLVPDSGLLITGAVMPAPPGGAQTAAVYMTVVPSADGLLVDAGSPACAEATLHESIVASDGTASMEHLHHMELVAGEPLVLSPGGLHIMCEGASPELAIGDMVPFSIGTADGSRLDFAVTVVDILDILE